ncbi:MAG: chemotaxis protein CheW [Myxococcaceae bacterium]|nr:chemotaxis protein CheW [Myxococcaceae bacterium]
MSDGSSGAEAQSLTFVVDEREFGVDILRVQEIRTWSPPMPIPWAPAWVKGVINLRGDIVPLVDVRERLGLAPRTPGEFTGVVVVRNRRAEGERVVGLIVDAMSDVVSIPDDVVKPAPDVGGAHDRSSRGIAVLHDKLVTLLDVDALLEGLGVDR